MNNIVEFYEKYDEDARLTTNNARKVEFIVSTSVLDEYIEPEHKILELGAGAGVYSFYYGEKGNEIIATDITPKHVEIIQSRVKESKKSLNLMSEVVDATDLSRYKSESFDVVLCMGPIYHITDDALRNKCIEECLRVLKKGGILAVAYINKHFVLNSVMLRDNKFLTKNFVDKLIDKGAIKEGEKECFWTDAFFTTPTEMEAIIKKFNVSIVDHAATDLISPFPFLRDSIDKMNEEEYSNWIYYSLRSSRERDILGISNHGLVICKK